MLNMKKEDFKMIEYINQIPNVRGIIQVGANSGQEVEFFKKFTNNIILIEPIPQLANCLNQTHPDCLVIPCGLGSTNVQMYLYLASNGGESSSVLKPISHTIYYPDITFDESIKIEIRTFESLIN
jgi:hypothetical protein